MIKIIYFGTTDFSATVLKALAQNTEFNIIAVVTQPARPIGRSQITTPSAISALATELGLVIFEPESLKSFSPDLLPPADIFIVYAYGLLIPQQILDLPPYGALNIHPSLLPQYRGPTPVQTALRNGETQTGVSVMVLDKQMDHGPILGYRTLMIDPEDTTNTLTHKLAQEAIPLLIELIPAWVNKTITPLPQNHEAASYSKLLSREDGKIDWQKNATEIYNLYRALTPWPGIWTMWKNKRLKLLRIQVTSESLAPGTIHIKNNHLFVGCKQNSLEIMTLQLEGKKLMDAAIFLNGNRDIDGAVLT